MQIKIRTLCKIYPVQLICEAAVACTGVVQHLACFSQQFGVCSVLVPLSTAAAAVALRGSVSIRLSCGAAGDAERQPHALVRNNTAIPAHMHRLMANACYEEVVSAHSPQCT